MVGGAVVCGMVGTVVVDGTDVEEVGGGVDEVVVSGWVVTVVSTGGEVGGGALVPGFRGAVVATVGWVLPVSPGGMVATVVVLPTTVEEVDVVGPLDVVVAATVVDVGRTVVVGDWVATCCFGEVSAPVATSNSMAARAMAART